MDNMTLRAEFAKQLHAAQEKYDYWLMAVAASAIALAVHDTEGAALQYRQIPLGCAVFMWGISFFAGCRRQIWRHVLMRTNAGAMSIADGADSIAGTDPERIAFGINAARSIFEEANNKVAKRGYWQFTTLILGSLFYLAWHVLNMWLRTKGAR